MGQLDSSLQRVLSMGGLARDGHLTTLLSKACFPSFGSATAASCRAGRLCPPRRAPEVRAGSKGAIG